LWGGGRWGGWRRACGWLVRYCEVVAYFSPKASEVAQAFDAEPCPKPVRAGLGLLAGSETAWSNLFDEAQ